MDKERTTEATAVVTGLGLAALGLFCGLALYSHDPADVMDYDAGRAGQLANLGGWLGARAAHHLLCLYGVSAWVLAAALLGFGAMICTARALSDMAWRGLGAVMLAATVSTWAGTLSYSLQEAAEGSFPAGPGGLLGGHYLAPPLTDLFGPVGIYLVLLLCGVLAGLMIGPEFTEAALAMLGRGCVWLIAAGWEALLGRLRPAFGPALVPALASAPAQGARGAGAATADGLPAGTRNDRIAVGETGTMPTRRYRGLLSGLAEGRTGNRTTARFTPPGETRTAAEVAQAEAQSEAEAQRLRHEEAVRQAEAAEQERLVREKEAKEHAHHEARALEKLEKERAAHDREREKARAKFLGAVAPAAAAPAATAATSAPAEAPAKPARLPDDYRLPDYGSLEAKDDAKEIASDVLKERGIKLIETLWEFKIGSRLASIVHGPAVTMFELSLDPGIKIQRVMTLQDNLAMAMKAEYGVRVVAPLPGRDTIGIEIPNSEDYVVRMRPILESTTFRGGSWTLPLVLGRDATGNPLVADLARMPHLLIAGTTGSGKSVCVNAIILSLLLTRRPQEVKMILVDPKQVELSDFKGVPHLLSPVVTDMKLAAGVLTWAVQKMEERYDHMSKVGVRNISTFNKLSRDERLARLPDGEPHDAYLDPMPYVVVIVDEFADLMLSSGKEIEQAMSRLAQKARAAGIHVILATQRPSADVVTGLIKANLPCRIAFQVKSKIDSRIVLDGSGAEKLAGRGDMLFVPPGSSQFVRAKGVFVADHELRAVVEFCKKQAEPIYSEEVERVASQVAQAEADGGSPEALPLDEKFEEAVECFLACGRASTSLLQRRMSLGYTRAAKVCDQMEALGIVGPDRGAKGRELLISLEGWDSYKQGKLGRVIGAAPRVSAPDGEPRASAPEQTQPGAAVPLVVQAPSPGLAAGVPAGALPGVVALLDDLDGTRAGAQGAGEDDLGDGKARPVPALVAQLEEKEAAPLGRVV